MTVIIKFDFYKKIKPATLDVVGFFIDSFVDYLYNGYQRRLYETSVC